MGNNPYKLLVVDIDGTLLGREKSISAGNRDALAKVYDLGIQVALSTGRVPQACLSIINQLSLDGCHIFFDGAFIGSPVRGEEVYAEPLDKALVRQAVEFCHSHDIALELYSATHYFVERETWASDIRREFFGIQPTIVDFTNICNRNSIIKGTLTVSSHEEVAKADSLRLQFNRQIRFSHTKSPAYPGVDFINVLAPEVSKGKALEVLASHLGVSMSEVIAIGDGTNDIPLLSLVGLAVAMGNAPNEVRAVASYVTFDVEQDGLAVAVKEFLL